MRIFFIRVSAVLLALIGHAACFAEDAATAPPATQPAAVELRQGEGTEMRRAWDALEFESAPSLKHLIFQDDTAAVEKRVTGKTLVIVFFSPASPASVQAVDDLAAKCESLGDGVEVLAILARTGGVQMRQFVEGKKWPFVVAADPSEASMGFKVGPLSKSARFYVVDSMGITRVAGANPQALPEFLKCLRNEPPWPTYPPFALVPPSEIDVQGSSIPKLDALEWVTPKPSLGGKITLIYTLNTGYPSCYDALPKIDALLKAHHELVLVCFSHEPAAAVKRLLEKYNYDGGFASDPKHVVEKALQDGGPNHLFVATPDGIIRWQGQGTKITEREIQAIIDADPAKIQARIKEMKMAAEKERRKPKKPVATTQP